MHFKTEKSEEDDVNMIESLDRNSISESDVLIFFITKLA
jgi:hypothetical protein